METVKLGISVKDRAYGKALGESLQRSYSGFIIYRLEEEMRDESFGDLTSSSMDVIIYDDLDKKGPGAVGLTEHRSSVNEEEGIFYKYDAGKNLASCILAFFSNKIGRKIIYSSSKDTFILAVHSAAGGSGATSISLAIAQELYRFRECRTLYISMENYISAGIYFNREEGKGLRDYVYYLLAGEEARFAFIDEFICTDDYGVEMFRSPCGINPLSELIEEHFRLFFSSLVNMGRYDAFVLDCGNNISKSSVCSMKIADKLLFLRGAKERDENYKSHLKHLAGDDIWDKTVQVINQYEWEEEVEEDEQSSLSQEEGEVTKNLQTFYGEEEEGEEVSSYYISRDPGSFKIYGDRCSISLDTDMGTDVKNVLDLLRK